MCVFVQWMWSHMCVCSPLRNNALLLKVLKANLRLFPPLSHWFSWLMKCSVIQSGEQIMTTSMNPTTRDRARAEVCTRERRVKLNAIIQVQSAASDFIHSTVCIAKKYNCVFMAFCLHDSRVSHSINQPSYCAPAAQMVALGFLSIQFTAVFHPQTPHHACHRHEQLSQSKNKSP